MDGSATLTMVMSRTIISMPVHSTTRAIQRLRSRTGVLLSSLISFTRKDGTGPAESSELAVFPAGNCPAAASHAASEAIPPVSYVRRNRDVHRREGPDQPVRGRLERTGPGAAPPGHQGATGRGRDPRPPAARGVPAGGSRPGNPRPRPGRPHRGGLPVHRGLVPGF